MSNRPLCLVGQQYYEGKINPAWGAYWVPADPAPGPDEPILAEVPLCPEFELVPDFPRLPANLWAAILHLYRYCCVCLDETNQETSVRLLRSEEDPSQWKVVVPMQKVTSISVRADDFNNCIDLISGEEYDHFPPTGWVTAGSSHSHNNMGKHISEM